MLKHLVLHNCCQEPIPTQQICIFHLCCKSRDPGHALKIFKTDILRSFFGKNQSFFLSRVPSPLSLINVPGVKLVFGFQILFNAGDEEEDDDDDEDHDDKGCSSPLSVL